MTNGKIHSQAVTHRLAQRLWLTAILGATLASLTLLIVVSSAHSAAKSSQVKAAATLADTSASKPTVVLVHGAFADASGWSGVITRLEHDGYPVIAPANPLRSLTGDSAYIKSVLAQTPGPIILVGHSYGGAVITNAAAGMSRVKALVYVDAFAPDIGESTLTLAGAKSQLPTAIESRAFPPFGRNDVEFYIKRSAFHRVFAADVPAGEAAVMAASQRPASALSGAEPTFAAAWKTIPSWYLLGLDDRTITPSAQRFMANRAHAHIMAIHSSHVAMVSHPGAVTTLIERAARATS